MAKAPVDLRSMARSWTEMGVRQLAGIAQHSENDSARVAAIALLFDRGWGKAAQTHTGADGEGDIRVVIRHIVQGRDIEMRQPVTLDAKPLAIEDGSDG